MRYLLSFLFTIYALFLYANIAQPGMWQAGGMGNFSLLFPEDSSAYQQIRMEREQVNIILYPGFAVVKGTYWMRNEGDRTLTIRTGYPINSQFESRGSRKLEQVMFEDLYALEVFIDGEAIEKQMEEFSDGEENVPYWAEGNWYIWNNTFPKDSLTRIDVYFIVNTNNASVLQGYNKAYPNGFIYLLETGAIWKQPIVKGEIRVHLSEELSIEKLNGITPAQFFSANAQERLLLGRFNNLSPNSKDNIIISYGQRVEGFDFAAVVKKAPTYYQEVDVFSLKDLGGVQTAILAVGDPFSVVDNGGFDFGRLFYWVVCGLLFLALFVFYFLIRWLLRRFV